MDTHTYTNTKQKQTHSSHTSIYISQHTYLAHTSGALYDLRHEPYEEVAEDEAAAREGHPAVAAEESLQLHRRPAFAAHARHTKHETRNKPKPKPEEIRN